MIKRFAPILSFLVGLLIALGFIVHETSQPRGDWSSVKTGPAHQALHQAAEKCSVSPIPLYQTFDIYQSGLGIVYDPPMNLPISLFEKGKILASGFFLNYILSDNIPVKEEHLIAIFAHELGHEALDHRESTLITEREASLFAARCVGFLNIIAVFRALNSYDESRGISTENGVRMIEYLETEQNTR